MNSPPPDHLPLDVALRQAVAHHRAGRLVEAEQLYRAILDVHPFQPDANHNLGILAGQAGRPAAGLPFLKIALTVHPEPEQYVRSYAETLLADGQVRLAREVLDAARQRGLDTPALRTLRERVESPPQATCDALIALFNAGRFAELDEKTRTLAEQYPECGFVWKVRGISLRVLGKEALPALRRAVELLPDDAEAHQNLGVSLKNLGQLEAAVTSYRRALDIHPDRAEVHSHLGNALVALGQLDDAAACYRQALALLPASGRACAEAHGKLGVVMGMQGDNAAALESLRRALEIDPQLAEAHGNLGAILKNLGRLDEAAASYRRALEIAPDYAMAHNNLGNVLNDLGSIDEAVASCRRALAIAPDFAEAHSNLGNALKNRGRLDEAVASYRRALALKPDLAEAWSNLGNTLGDLGHCDEALASCRRALALRPDLAEAHNNLGNVLKKFGQTDAAVASYRQALALKPGFAMAHSNLIFALDMATNADIGLRQAERRRWDAMHAQPLAALQRPHANPPDPARRLRIGYVSADFCWHSAARVFGSLLLQFDPAGFEVFAYSNGLKEDVQTQLFRQGSTGWRNIVGCSDDEVAELIRQDGIDILVDLSGHSAGNRLLVFARKPAPIQVTAWGYATGTGMRAIDVFFADPVVVPPGEKECFVEAVRYLPSVVGSHFPEAFPAVHALPALSNKGITFGSFNRLGKMSEDALTTWARILQALPDSRLVIKANELDDAGTRERMMARFDSAGVKGERIRLLGNTSWNEHVAAFGQIDLVLDPFPHGGGVSTLEGLMMGVPVVTLRWPSIAGRLSASILTTLGMTDWIAETPERYVDLAIRKAGDLPALASLRETLRERLRSSVIGDARAYVGAVEREYRALWREWCGRQAARPVDGAIKTIAQEMKSPSPEEISTLAALFEAGRHGEAEALARAMTLRFPQHGFGWKALGAVCREMGRLEEAEAAMQKAVALLPDNAEAHNNLGVVLKELQRHATAAASCRRAVALRPDYAEAHYNLGNALNALGQPEDAVACYRRAVAIKPDYAEAHYNLGTSLSNLKKPEEAVASYRQAIDLRPEYAEAHYNLGNTLDDLGRLDEAVTHFRRTTEIRPDHAEAWLNLGNALNPLEQLEAAATCYRKALEIRPDFAEAYSNLGLVLRNLGQLEDALVSCRRALDICPDHAAALSNMGVILKDLGRTEEALDSYRRALEIKPDFVEAHSNLGNILKDCGQLAEAVACYREALRIAPDYADAYSNLGSALKELGQLDDAVACYREALRIKPDFANAHSNLIFALDLKGGLDTRTLLAERRRWGETFADTLCVGPSHGNVPDPERRLRIGYVSADFREHSAAVGFGAMLTRFDPERFDVFAYSASAIEDEHTRLFRRCVTGWRSIVGRSDADVAATIRQDAIDILVDLSGHSCGHRLRVFARKPAPIQISAWGYAGGTGMRTMDYLFSDVVVVPETEKALFTEKVLYLPSAISAFFPSTFPEIGALPALSADDAQAPGRLSITFGSLNRLSKVSEDAFKTWSEILRAVPSGSLLLKAPELEDAEVRAQISRRFVAAGIDPSRLSLLGRTTWLDHVAVFKRIDIALDPFPQSGGVTTLEGLMMGVPVMTLRGPSFVGRGSASLLTTLGLTDWIAETPAQYVDLAVRKTENLAALAELRQQLRPRFLESIIGDTAAYARTVEDEYRKLWREWCEGVRV